MRRFSTLAALGAGLLLLAAAPGCREEGPGEKVGRQLDEAAEDLSDAAEDAADEAKNKLDE